MASIEQTRDGSRSAPDGLAPFGAKTCASKRTAGSPAGLDPEILAVCETAFDVLRAQLLDAGFQPQPKTLITRASTTGCLVHYSCAVCQTSPDDEPFELSLALQATEDGALSLTLDASNHAQLSQALAHRLIAAARSREGGYAHTGLKTALNALHFYLDDNATAAPGLNFYSPHLWIHLLSPALLSALQP